MSGPRAFCTPDALPSKPRHHASFPNFPGVCSIFCLRLFCLHFFGKSAGGRKMSLCRAAGGADGHCRPNERCPRVVPDPDNDGAEAGPLSSATPAYRIGPRKCVFTYSIEYLDRRLNPCFFPKVALGPESRAKPPRRLTKILQEPSQTQLKSKVPTPPRRRLWFAICHVRALEPRQIRL